MSTIPTCPYCGSQAYTYKEEGTSSDPVHWYTKCLKDCLESGSCQTGDAAQAAFARVAKYYRSNTTSRSVDFNTYKQMVCHAVKENLGSRPWYRGVCTDTMQGSYDSGASVEQAAQTAASDTTMWDAPMMGVDE